MRKEFIEKTAALEQVRRHASVLLSYVNFEDMTVAVHLNQKQVVKDYPRMVFLLFTLSRVYRADHAATTLQNKRREILIVFWAIYEYAKKNLEEKDFLYVVLYGMRFLNNLGESYQRLVSDFSSMRYAALYGYPVSAYLYLSTYQECEALRTGYDFSLEIMLQCKKAFDFWLFSNTKDALLPFHFSELSLHPEILEQELIVKASTVISQKFSEGYLRNDRTSSSGVAKCMEDFARRGLTDRLEECMNFLEGRRLSKFQNYLRPDQEKNADVLFTEDTSSQYVCLDTNAHLLHTYMNIYERNQ